MPDQSEIQEVNQIIKRARIAQTDFEKNGSQEKYDTAAQAVGWAISCDYGGVPCYNVLTPIKCTI